MSELSAYYVPFTQISSFNPQKKKKKDPVKGKASLSSYLN